MVERAGLPPGSGSGAYEKVLLGGGGGVKAAAPSGEEVDTLTVLGDTMATVGKEMAEILAAHPNEDVPTTLQEVGRLGEALSHPRCSFPYFAQLSAACVARERVDRQLFYYHVPPNPRGHVILMHGGGVGRAEDWFVRINRLDFAKTLIHQGFAVSAYQSMNQWGRSSYRADRDNLERVGATLRKRGALSATGEALPEFAVCVSAGCGFLSRYAKERATDGRPLQAQYFSMPWGISDRELLGNVPHTAPTFVAVGKNDEVPFTNSPASMGRFVTALREAGKDARMVINPKSAAGECFHNLCKMPGVGMEDTRALVSGLKERGILDKRGEVAVVLPNRQGVANPYEGVIMDAFLNVRAFCDWPLFSITGPMVDWVYQELSELEGAHRHTSDFDAQVVRFFLSHMPHERRAGRPPAGGGK